MTEYLDMLNRRYEREDHLRQSRLLLELPEFTQLFSKSERDRILKDRHETWIVLTDILRTRQDGPITRVPVSDNHNWNKEGF